MKRRKFTAAFKRKVVLEALRGDETVRSIASRHGVHPNQVGKWKTEAHDGLLEVFARGKGKSADRETERLVVCTNPLLLLDPGLCPSPFRTAAQQT